MPRDMDCGLFLTLLDALGDDAPSREEEALLAAHAAVCASCASELEVGQGMARAFRRLPTLRCPPALTRRVLERAEREAGQAAGVPWSRRAGRALRQWLPWAGSWPPAASTAWRPLLAGALLAVAAAAGISYRSRPAPPPTFTPAEVAQAQNELELVFSYLGRIGADTGVALREEVVDHVFQPTRRALGGPAVEAGP